MHKRNCPPCNENQEYLGEIEIDRPRLVLGELSPEAKAARLPLRPEELIDALHDRVHPTSGRLLAAKPIKTRRE
jgi:hypothetical protein